MPGVLDNSRKQALAYNLNAFAGEKANDALELLGKALPCRVTAVNGQIVTVAFELNVPFPMPSVTIPLHTSVYDWQPIQVGDKGLALSADTYLGGISGLGGGTADLTRRANLATMCFLPVSNSSWQPPGGDPNKRVVQGPGGARVQDTGGKSVIITDPTSGITLQPPPNQPVQVQGSMSVAGTISAQASSGGGGGGGGGGAPSPVVVQSQFPVLPRYSTTMSGQNITTTSTGWMETAVTFPATSRSGAFLLFVHIKLTGTFTAANATQNVEADLYDGGTQIAAGPSWFLTSPVNGDSWGMVNGYFYPGTFVPGSSHTFSIGIAFGGGSGVNVIGGALGLQVLEAG